MRPAPQGLPARSIPLQRAHEAPDLVVRELSSEDAAKAYDKPAE